MAAEKINKIFRDGDILHAEELNAILSKFNDNVNYINALPTETLKGDNGSSPISCYKWFEKNATVNAPTSKVVEPDGWLKYAPSMPSDTSKTWYLWMSSNTLNGDGTITENWSIPVRISGEDGDNGTDAKDREWIYSYSQTRYNGNTGQISPTGEANGTNTEKETKDDWVPNGWYDRALSVSAENPDVYASWRDYNTTTKKWGNFNPPINWSHWGSKGLDGDGVQYIYKLYPEEIEGNNLNVFKPTKTTQNEKGEWLPVTPSPSDTNTLKSWTDDAETPTDNFPYCYCSVIKQINGEWGNYGPLSLWAKYSKDGVPGSSPINCYKWVTIGNTPERPVNNELDPENPEGWSKYAPNREEGKYLWMSSNTKNGDGTVTESWSTPVRISGEDGDVGTDSKDREWIYKYDAEGYNGTIGEVSPTNAAGEVIENNHKTDDWVPKGWYDRALTISENNPNVYASWRDYNSGTWGDFHEPILWSHWGESGVDGDGVLYIYKLYRSLLSEESLENNIPEKPASQTEGEWIPEGWSDNPLTPTEVKPYCYCSTIKQINGVWGNFNKLSLWSLYAKEGKSFSLSIEPSNLLYNPNTKKFIGENSEGKISLQIKAFYNGIDITTTSYKNAYTKVEYTKHTPSGLYGPVQTISIVNDAFPDLVIDNTDVTNYSVVKYQFNLKVNINSTSTTVSQITIPVVQYGEATIGPMSYLAGTWDANTTYTKTETKNPIVYYVDNNSYYYLIGNTLPISSTGENPSTNTNKWALAENYNMVFTDILFVNQFAKLGSFIVNNDWLITRHGTIYDASGNSHIINERQNWINGGTTYDQNNAYTTFKADYPQSNKSGEINFVPNVAIDARTGESYFNKAHVTGDIKANSGIFNGIVNATQFKAGDDSRFSVTTNSDSLNFNYNGSRLAFFSLRGWDETNKQLADVSDNPTGFYLYLTNPLNGHLITIDFTNLSFKDLNYNQVLRHESSFYRLSCQSGKVIETPVTLYYSIEDGITKWWRYSDSTTELTSAEMGTLYRKQNSISMGDELYYACVLKVNAQIPYIATRFMLYELQTLLNNVPTKTGNYAMSTHLNADGSYSTDNLFVVPDSINYLNSSNTNWNALMLESSDTSTVNNTLAITVIRSGSSSTVPTFTNAFTACSTIDANGDVSTILYPTPIL